MRFPSLLSPQRSPSSQPMNSATYNLHDDRLKVWFADRLSNDEYAAAKAAGFVYWHGSKCFTCVWRPKAQDFIEKHGIEIECIAEADDVAARVERYDKYAENAENRASNATERLETGAANTARRQRLAENVAAREFGNAAHWQARIAAAIRHAAHKENPDLILRRIKNLETDLRRHETAQKVDETCTDGPRVWVGGNGRGQGFYRERSEIPALIAYHKRWAEHIGHRIEYEQARLAATGHTLAKLASNEITLELGGAVKLNRRWTAHEGWYYITKLNPSSIEVWSPYEAFRSKWVKIPRDEIGEIASAADVESGQVSVVAKPEVAKPSSQPKGTQSARDGKTPEKWGALGASDGFMDRLEDCRWYLITKVNRTTVEYLSKQQTRKADGSLSWSYYIKKTDIRLISFLKTAEQVKTEHPDLLADWAKVEEIRERNEARKAAQQVEAATA